MNRNKKWPRLIIVGVAITVFLLGATSVFAGSLSDRFGPFGSQIGEPSPAGFGRRGGFGGLIDHEALLAEVLGISVEDLQAAQQQAYEAAIQQALDEGLITQAQADQLLQYPGGHRRAGFGRRGLGFLGWSGGDIDYQALLAEALSISVEELQAAQEQARTAAIQQALDEGLITQEEADLMQAFEQLKSYLDEARTAAIAQAVADGVITQGQADQFLSYEGRGFRGPDFYGGHGPGRFGGLRGNGHPGGF